MNYSQFYYHVSPICHYLFSIVFLFLFVPKWLFKSNYKEFGERMMNRSISMIFLLIISGYLLVITKLYEVISIVIMLCIMYGVMKWLSLHKQARKPTISYILKYIFDLLDGLHYTNRMIIKSWFSEQIGIKKTQIKEKFHFNLILEWLLLLIILVVAIYIRFYDVFQNAAPPLADSYVTLAWMKYIDSRELFHDGIYPQGFHIILATIMKFASIDALFVLRYTGPLNTMLITIGLYFVVRKLTRNGIGALTAASIYGCLLGFIYWFPIERQVGTNSQEFAFVFIYPVLFFLIRYCLTNKIHYLYTGMLGTAVIGLVHSFAFMFIGLLIGVLIVCHFILTRSLSRQIWKIVGFSLLTVIVALIPFFIGLLLGKGFHSTSVDYLLSNKNHQSSPSLVIVDYITLASIFLTIMLLFSKKMSFKERFVGLFAALAGVITFGIYYLGGPLTNSVLVASRSSELWGILVPFLIGTAVSLLFTHFSQKWTFVTYGLFASYLFIILMILHPRPIVAYKMEHNANIEQYLKIRNEYRPKTWLMISNDEGYAVSLGSGYHMHIHDFLKIYNPEKRALTKKGETKPDSNVPPDIFILLEKRIFKVSKSNSIYPLLEQKYANRQNDNRKLVEWLNLHKKFHHPVTIFYEDSNIIIYHLHLKTAKQKQDKMIWSDLKR